MSPMIKNYMLFLAFVAVTKILVKPTVSSLNVPLLTAIVS